MNKIRVEEVISKYIDRIESYNVEEYTVDVVLKPNWVHKINWCATTALCSDERELERFLVNTLEVSEEDYRRVMDMNYEYVKILLKYS